MNTETDWQFIKKMKKTVRVFASMQKSNILPDWFHYAKFSLTSPKTGNVLTLSGFYDGDMCEDIRRKIFLATCGGETQKVEIYLTVEDCYRWMNSVSEYISHYTP